MMARYARKIEVYWDAQDTDNTGWAYRAFDANGEAIASGPINGPFNDEWPPADVRAAIDEIERLPADVRAKALAITDKMDRPIGACDWAGTLNDLLAERATS